jgi:hypothetical protein
MTTLLEIESAVEALPSEQKVELLRFLAERLRAGEGSGLRARLVPGPRGTLLLEAPLGAPPMTTDMVKQALQDFP